MERYSILAKYYDWLVADDDARDEWVDWIEEALPKGRILELACGSGEITRKLADDGYDMDALDLSEGMIKQAKAKDPEGTVHYAVGDMRNLEGYGQYDGIACLCDSFNYLLEDTEVEAFFDEVARHLNENGLFFFDSHSMDRLEEFEDDYEEAGQFEDGTDVQWVISSEDDRIYQDFAFYLPDGQLIQEHHIQRVYDPDWLHEKLNKNFRVLSINTDFDEKGIQEGEKYFFICQKK